MRAFLILESVFVYQSRGGFIAGGFAKRDQIFFRAKIHNRTADVSTLIVSIFKREVS